MLRPPIGDLVLGEALPAPDPQLPEPFVDDRLTAEPRRQGCRRLHGPGERTRHQPVDRFLTKDIGDRRGGPNPSRLDALVEPTHRPALAVRGRAAVADQVDATHPSLLSLARTRCSVTPNGSRPPRLWSTHAPSNTIDRTHPASLPADNAPNSEPTVVVVSGRAVGPVTNRSIAAPAAPAGASALLRRPGVPVPLS